MSTFTVKVKGDPKVPVGAEGLKVKSSALTGVKNQVERMIAVVRVTAVITLL